MCFLQREIIVKLHTKITLASCNKKMANKYTSQCFKLNVKFKN